MIHVKLQPEPERFGSKVRRPGLKFLKKHPMPRASMWNNHEYWRAILPDLHRMYRCICAYSCHWIPPDTGGRTVEHFLVRAKYPEQAYEWSNYRLVCQTLNGRKGHHEDVLDPFLVKDGWFVLDFDSLRVKPAAVLGRPLRQRVQATIERLRLNDGGTCLQNRMAWFDDYCKGHITFEYLQRRAPFVAKELERQDRIEEVRARQEKIEEVLLRGHRAESVDPASQKLPR